METMPDHLHIFLSAPPTVAPTEIVRKLKSITANSKQNICHVSAGTIRKYIEAQKSPRKEVKNK